jgi:light-regulated signal transduction histidine kinase (bacteriophytochrome)
MEAEMFHRAQELQQANTQLRAMNEELARKEKDLAEGSEGLQRMATQLEGANKELEAFSYSVSHDLRAPVRHIAGYVELLEEYARPLLGEKGHRYIKTIAESAKQMGTLIDDLLAFSKMGRIEFSEAVVNLELLVKEVMEDLKPDLEGRTIEWNIGALPCVLGDPSMLRQVFSNLLSNAVKFTAKRAEAKIEVGVAFDRQLAHETVLFVRDNGAGFDMEYAHKLFGVFQRLHRTSEFEGTGIGLANIRRIIERHGGRTWAEGAVGAGAVFYFSLPNRGSAGD